MVKRRAPKGNAMNRDHLTNDASLMAAYRITELVAMLLREEEQTDFLHESFGIIRAAMEAFSIQLQREQRRAQPSRN